MPQDSKPRDTSLSTTTEHSGRRPKPRLTADDLEKAAKGEVAFDSLPKSSEDELRSLARFAYMLLQEGKLDRAKRIFTSLTRIAPHIGPFHTGVAEALLREGSLEAAFPEIQKALEINPTDDVALAFRGEIHLRTGKDQEAGEDFLNVIRRDPDLTGNPARYALRFVFGALQELGKRGPVPKEFEQLRSALAAKLSKTSAGGGARSSAQSSPGGGGSKPAK